MCSCLLEKPEVPELGFAPLLALAPSLLSSVGGMFGQQQQLKAQKSAQKNQMILAAIQALAPKPAPPQPVVQRVQVPVPVPVPVQTQPRMMTSPIQTRETGISNTTLLIGGGVALAGLLLFMQK